MAADACGAGGHDHVGVLQRVKHRPGRQPLGAELGWIDIDHDLARFAAEGRGRRQAGNGEQLDADEVQRIVSKLLLGQRLARNGHLHHRHIGGVVLDDGGRRHARRHNVDDRGIDGTDLGDGGAHIGARLEIDLQDADARYRLGFDAADAVDSGGIGALADHDDAPLHVGCRQARIGPHHQHHRNVDDGKNVHDHPGDGQDTQKRDQQRGDSRGIGPAQGEADERQQGGCSGKSCTVLRHSAKACQRDKTLCCRAAFPMLARRFCLPGQAFGLVEAAVGMRVITN